MAIKRNIKYVNRDFNDFRDRLIEYAKTYFPNTYNDFTPSSPGMMFMEMSAYVGDVLSFYLDNQIQETFIQYARQTENLFELAYLMGYKPKVTGAAQARLDIYLKVPASSGLPDYDYVVTINENTAVRSSVNGGVNFLLQDKVDFGFSSSLDPTEVTVYETSGGTPQSFLLKKSVNAISATIKSANFSFTDPVAFATVQLNDTNIIGVLDIVDSDGNVWYEVSHLAQDTVFDSIKNTSTNDPNLSQAGQDVPYLLQTKSVSNRFATRFLNDTTLQIQFGAGTATTDDEEITPNPDNVGLGLPFQKDKLTTAYSPTNFIFTDSYGTAPANTTLTVRYLTGGGVNANVGQNTINTFVTRNITFNNSNLNASTAQDTFDSITVTNPDAATGGQDGDTIEELRENSLVNFQNQLRTVTQDDYLLRALSMPPIYGSLAKAYAQAEKLQDLLPGEVPAVVNLYVLSLDNQGNLQTASEPLKQNLRTYLSQYRVINDSVRIKDAYVVNIGVDFEIITYPNTNNNQVLLACNQQLQNYFNLSRWQINEPIILKDLYILLDQVEGVQTVKNISITNKAGTAAGYSQYSYDTAGATRNNVVYPSIDPMIFEVKYPNTDIRGRVVPL